MIKFRCSRCTQKIGVPEQHVGKKVKCPTCSTANVVPDLEVEVPVVEIAEPIEDRKDNADVYDLLDELEESEFGEGSAGQEQTTTECYYCGETIVATARKCKHCGEFFNSSPVEPYPSGFPTRPTITKKIPYAGFWIRVLGSLIDVPVYVVIYLVGSFLAGFIMGSIVGTPDMWTDAEFMITNVLIYLIVYLAQSIYKATMESSGRQGTLGKMALGLKVVDLDGNRISYGRAMGRFWLQWIMCIVPILGLIAVCMAGWTQKKQTLYDKICGTIVIKGR